MISEPQIYQLSWPYSPKHGFREDLSERKMCFVLWAISIGNHMISSAIWNK